MLIKQEDDGIDRVDLMAGVSPERRLVAAIVLVGIQDYYQEQSGRRFHPSYTGPYYPAALWIFEGDPALPNSFDHLCELIELDPGKLRKKIQSHDTYAALRRAMKIGADYGLSTLRG